MSPIGVIGEKADLTYDYAYLGAGAESLAQLSPQALEKLGERPCIIVGAGALARADGAAILGAARRPRRRSARSRTAGTASTCCTPRRPRRRPRCRRAAGRGRPRHASILDAARGGDLDVLYLLGADEIDMAAPGRAFVIYQGSHGDAGAHRADVILPGAAYTEKSVTYVNTEGRPQMTRRAVFPPGEAREDWAIIRALSEALGAPQSWNTLAELRAAMYKVAPHLAAPRPGRAGRCGGSRALAEGEGETSPEPFLSPDHGLLPHQPDRARLAHHGRMLGPAVGRDAGGGGVGDERDDLRRSPLSSSRAWRLLVALLIVIAFLLYADRKVWAAVQMRRGPNVVGPWGLLQSFADLLKFVFKEVIIPDGANKGVFIIAPLVTALLALAAWAVIPLAGWLGHRRHQCRHPLSLRHLLARRLWRHHGRLGVELEISLPRRAALGRADGVLRSLDRLRHHHRAALRRLAQSERHRARAGDRASPP